MIEPEEVETIQAIALKVRSAFQIREPDQLFIDRLDKKLAERFKDLERSSESKNSLHMRSHWLDKFNHILSPIPLAVTAVLLILFLIWGIKTLIPGVGWNLSSQATPSPTMVPTPVATQAGGAEVGTLGYGYAINTAWSSDGQTLAVGTSAGIVLYAADNLQEAPAWYVSSVGSVKDVSFSPDSSQLAIAGWEGLSLWNLVTGQEKVLQTEGGPFAAAFSPDGKLLASGNSLKYVQIWDVASGKLVSQLKDGDMEGSGMIAFSPDGKMLASGDSDRTEGHGDGIVRLWELSTGNLMLKLGDKSHKLAAPAFSPDGKTLAFGGSDNSVELWDIASGKLVVKLVGHAHAVVSVAFSPNGLQLASLDVGKDNQVRVWDISSGRSVRIFDGCSRTNNVNTGFVDFSPDGSRLTSACEDEGLFVWNIDTGQVQKISQGYSYGVRNIAFSSDGKRLASSDSNWDKQQAGDILLWNLETKTEYLRLSGHTGIVTTVAFNPNGNQVASGGIDGTVRLWNTTTGESIIVLKGYPDSFGSLAAYGITLKNLMVNAVAFSPDGSLLAVGGGGGSGPGWLELYDSTTGKRLNLLDPTCNFPCEGAPSVIGIAFSPDGALLASANQGGVWLWDVAHRQKIHQLVGKNISMPVDFSSDGKILATGEGWGSYSFFLLDILGGVHFWDVKTGEMLDKLDVGEELIYSIAFSPDGKLLAVGHEQNVVLWDITTRQILTQIDSGDFPVISFSIDGSLLAIGDLDGVIRLWGVPGD
jgi:WD40 repeat protein